MNIKGTFLTITKSTIIEAFGLEKWNAFMAKMAEKDKYFKDTVIMTITLVPVEKSIMLLDGVIDEFFNGDRKNSYILFGRIAAKFALTKGGFYHFLMQTKDIKTFVENNLPKIWSIHFDGGSVTARLENNDVLINITDFPVKNEYYEKFITAYYKQVLKIFGKKSTETVLRSISAGNKDVYIKYALQDA
ncbi:MAG TPA: hypothetical protein PLV50_09470 [Smithella sp.]|nr:hypothetical protein [Smithella sp.]HNY50353.1 hypothetical protein [Smithella sp.]HOG90757.1 hypothetical protein [Smithella sp.]